MKKLDNIKNDCKLCAYCVKHYVEFNGKLHLVDDNTRCINDNMTEEESKERITDKVMCEHFKLLSLPESTDLDNIAYALSGIMSELYEIKLILKKRKSKTEKTSDRTI